MFTGIIEELGTVEAIDRLDDVGRELGLPEARVRAADPRLWFARAEG